VTVKNKIQSMMKLNNEKDSYTNLYTLKEILKILINYELVKSMSMLMHLSFLAINSVKLTVICGPRTINHVEK